MSSNREYVTGFLELFPGSTPQEIAERSGVALVSVYAVLAVGEEKGRIRSEWVEGPYPRTRRYFLVEKEE